MDTLATLTFPSSLRQPTPVASHCAPTNKAEMAFKVKRSHQHLLMRDAARPNALTPSVISCQQDVDSKFVQMSFLCQPLHAWWSCLLRGASEEESSRFISDGSLHTSPSGWKPTILQSARAEGSTDGKERVEAARSSSLSDMWHLQMIYNNCLCFVFTRREAAFKCDVTVSPLGGVSEEVSAPEACIRKERPASCRDDELFLKVWTNNSLLLLPCTAEACMFLCIMPTKLTVTHFIFDQLWWCFVCSKHEELDIK